MTQPVFLFILCVLASWRLSYLITKEDGPFDVIAIIRNKLGNNVFGRMMDCFYCTNLWVSAVIGILISSSVIEFFLFAFSISGAACIINLIIENLCVADNQEK